jgi:hypothetical protein
MEVFKINYVFSYGDTDSIVISHTGLEDVSLVDSSEINRVYSYRYNNDSHYYKRQTSLAGASATISESDISTLENAALSMTLWEKTKIITESYADPEMASKYLGLWKVRYMNCCGIFIIE